MRTIEEFADEFRETQDGLMRDYTNGDDTERPGIQPVCHMMHQDLGLGTTPTENAEEEAERLSEMVGHSVDPEELDLTIEHRQLHAIFHQMRLEAMMNGLSVSDIMALMFTVGRRMGMREAALAFDDGGEFGALSIEPTELPDVAAEEEQREADQDSDDQ